MGLKLYGMPMASCTQKVLNALFEKNVPYEMVTVSLFTGDQKKPDYMKLQPFGKIPVLEDDGFFIYESRAIVKYIAKNYAGQGTKLVPDDSDIKAYARFEQACSIETSYFDKAGLTISVEKHFKAMRQLPPDETKVTEAAAELDIAFSAYDVILSNQAYLAGDEVTCADLFHLPYGMLIKKVGYSNLFEKYPHVDKWFTSLEKRESWVKTLAAIEESK